MVNKYTGIKVSGEKLEELRQWFDNYVETFKGFDTTTQRNIDIKALHSRKVRDEIIYISKELGLREDALRLAEIIGLYHDVGRFEQYTRYKTFKDKDSVNHAELGIQIMKEKKILDILGFREQEIILKAINFHNRPVIPSGEKEPFLLFERLIRDADKLDIYRLVTDFYNRKNGSRDEGPDIGMPDTPGFSKNVINDLLNQRIVKISDLQNLNDFKLFQIGWIYDVNFEPSVRKIKEKSYLELIRKVLPGDKIVDEVFDVIYQSCFN